MSQGTDNIVCICTCSRITPEVVERAEGAMLQFPQAKAEVFHHFKEGKYFREVRLPAGNFAIGHHQNFEHLNVFIKGRVSLLCEDGTFKELKAPMVFVGNPGRKIGYIHEDTIWYNVYATTETDIAELEKKYLTISETFKRRPLDEAKFMAAIEAQKDYVAVLTERGLDQHNITYIVENEADQIPMPDGSYKFQTGKSAIHGKGIFATGDIESGECVGVARVGGKRTPLGRFTNHSNRPNAQMVFTEDGDVYLHALTRITGQRGGELGEEIVIDYRDPLRKIHNI